MREADVATGAAQDAGADMFRRDVLAGLSGVPRQVPGKYLWDDAGLHLFDAITASPSYYPMAAEMALLREAAPDIAALVDPRCIVEFGSGACQKAGTLLDACGTAERYVAIDIADDFLRAASRQLGTRHPRLEVIPVCADFLRGLPPLPLPGEGPVLGYFSGTSIGNMPPETAVRLLARIGASLGRGWLLIGADPTTDGEDLLSAYGSGEMAAFHANLLVRMVRELGAELRRGDFGHEVRLRPDPLRVEASLVARRDTAIAIGPFRASFRPGEGFRTDVSYKYPAQAFDALADAAGWVPQRRWADRRGRFVLHLLRSP